MNVVLVMQVKPAYLPLAKKLLASSIENIAPNLDFKELSKLPKVVI